MISIQRHPSNPSRASGLSSGLADKVERIMKDLKIECFNGGIEWLWFLHPLGRGKQKPFIALMRECYNNGSNDFQLPASNFQLFQCFNGGMISPRRTPRISLR